MSGGGGEIRTHGPFLIDCFQGSWVKPLPHISVLANPTTVKTDLVKYRSLRWNHQVQGPLVASS